MKMADDVLVVGAGAVGASLALALARDGRSVTVMDGRPGPTALPGASYAPFVVALNLASLRLLTHLDIWPRIAAFRASPYIAMELWDQAGGGHIRFDSTEIGEARLGYFVEGALLEAALHEALQQTNRVQFLWGTRPERLVAHEDRVIVETDQGEEAVNRLLVGADGAQSRVRDLLGMEATVRAYDQKAIVCNFATEQHHGGVARQQFLAGGPVAFLPLADGRCSLAWFRSESEAERLLSLDEAAFCQELTQASGRMLGRVVAAEPRRGIPIVRRHAKNYVADRAVLVGDAAHAIHPLAGQGLNLGLLDVASLADRLLAVRDPGHPLALRAYARERRGHNTAVMSAMDGFHYGFAFGGPFQQRLRSLGMNLADQAGPFKRHAIRMGAGIAGELPPRLRR